ncbi:TonB-dependent receptor [hydrothermal vent metagenome]|uniref:TonB-dependent receptor n=1 Tax=hydrothermal vent metagenome TaxID=652676 RepID=A0A3B0TYQ3_9ZZZZ
MKRSFVFLFIGMFCLYGYSQNSLSGTVSNNGNGEPLEQVSIFFPKLGKGATTNVHGIFIINGLAKGRYKIVVSHLGYKTHSETIEIKSAENNLNITLVPSVIEMEEVIVSTPFHKLQRENVMKVEQAKVIEFKTKGAFTLSDGITTMPGVESVSTGIGIGKPVIRGLSSNRVLVYVQGIRLENQQFGGEHGLGTGDSGIESVEVIKGPASLLYGSDAMGGVLYLNPEKFALPNETDTDVNLNYFSNTEGIHADAGFKKSAERFKFIVRGGISSHADYQTGDKTRVTNSRFTEYDLKTALGYQATVFKTELRYNYNQSELGIPKTIAEQTKKRTPVAPYQEIGNHILSSKSNMFFENSSLETTFGYIFNTRKEFEEGEELAALEMDLATFNYNVLYHLPKWYKLETIVGVQGMHQTNTNAGEEILIPDAVTNDIGVLATSHLHLNDKSDLQFGIRYDHRKITGKESGTPTDEGYIARLDRKFNSFNAALGYKMNLSESITARINTATGFRAPNLAELTSNGVHEGTNRFEIGNADLNNEKNFQVDVALEYRNEHFELYINGFHNSINDYIFIVPNGNVIGIDDVFIYRQQDAKLYGGEMGLHLHPHSLDWLHIESTFETVTGKLKDNSSLPLIPANNWTNTLRVEAFKDKNWLKKSYAFVSLMLYFDKNDVSDFESVTNGYNLLNLGFGGSFAVFGQDMDIRISGNNLLNETYTSHLSRLKTNSIANIGRNISVGISVGL